MKIYAVSDMHGNLDGLDPSGSDIAVVAGDFAKLNGRGRWHVYDQKKWVQKKFIPWIESYPDVKFVIVPGNHDLFADPKYQAAWPDVNYAVDWPENAKLLINSGCESGGLKFWGVPNVPIINYSWAFESDHDTLEKAFSSVPRGVDVLVVHTPPRIPGRYIDFSVQTASGPFGSCELTNALIDKRPRFVFCGHIHSGDHSPEDFAGGRIYNVSRVDEWYEPAYEPAVVDV